MNEECNNKLTRMKELKERMKQAKETKDVTLKFLYYNAVKCVDVYLEPISNIIFEGYSVDGQFVFKEAYQVIKIGE